jgi:hypothetical protein
MQNISAAMKPSERHRSENQLQHKPEWLFLPSGFWNIVSKKGIDLLNINGWNLYYILRSVLEYIVDVDTLLSGTLTNFKIIGVEISLNLRLELILYKLHDTEIRIR